MNEQPSKWVRTDPEPGMRASAGAAFQEPYVKDAAGFFKGGGANAQAGRRRRASARRWAGRAHRPAPETGVVGPPVRPRAKKDPDRPARRLPGRSIGSGQGRQGLT
ncbi:MAG TPA: hypothetical protein VF702_14740 [Allosphingosinicella sp.]|jgi:hypothetical protein